VSCNAINNGDDRIGWQTRSILAGATFDFIGSKRRFGVEIETAQCKHYSRIENQTFFGAKFDGTIDGKEFDSPILCGDEGLAIVHHFCDIAKRRGWEVNDRCGTHIHLDMSREREDRLRSIIVGYLYTYQSWAKLVHPKRLNNAFCMPPSYNPTNILNTRHSFHSIIQNAERYEFINFRAYQRHRTFEIRGLEGTLDKKLLTNWIVAHLTFVDLCATLSVEQIGQLFNQPEPICWDNLRKMVLGDIGRYFARLRAKQAKSEHQ
jgi:hypothetical protein